MAYNLFQSEFIPETNLANIKKRKPKVIYQKQRQTGTRINLEDDKKRIALPPGKRRSKNGKIYYEYRKDRTDLRNLGI